MSRHLRRDSLKTGKDRSLACLGLPWACEWTVARSEPLATGAEDVELVAGGPPPPGEGGQPIVPLKLSAEPEQDRDPLGGGDRPRIGLPLPASSSNPL